MVEVISINETGVTCKLLEYDDKEAYLSINEWSRKRISNIKSFTHIGFRFAGQVIRVDVERNYIDLSRKNVNSVDSENVNSKFQSIKNIHNILQRVSSVSNVSMLQLYTHVVWPIAKTQDTEECFIKFIREPETLDIYFDPLEKESQTTAKNEFLNIIKHRYVCKPSKLIAKVQLFCYSEKGIDAVKDALLAGKNTCKVPDIPISITVESCPIYVISTTCENTEQGIKLIKECMDSIKNNIEKVPNSKFEIGKFFIFYIFLFFISFNNVLFIVQEPIKV